MSVFLIIDFLVSMNWYLSVFLLYFLFKVEIDSLVLDFKLNLGSVKIYHTAVSSTVTDFN